MIIAIDFDGTCVTHEYQWGRVYLRIVHLWGGHWDWKLWRRFSLRIVPKESA